MFQWELLIMDWKKVTVLPFHLIIDGEGIKPNYKVLFILEMLRCIN